MTKNNPIITASFDGGLISFEKSLLLAVRKQSTLAIGFDHRDEHKSGGYFIRENGEIVKVGGSKLPALGILLASIGAASAHLA